MNTRQLGQQGEALAEAYLKRKHYRILGKNYHCRFGEIDLICQKDDIIVFVEVKLRRNNHFSDAWEAVTAAKQGRIRATALQWMAEQSCQLPARFDVIEVYTDDDRICHIEDAFQ